MAALAIRSRRVVTPNGERAAAVVIVEGKIDALVAEFHANFKPIEAAADVRRLLDRG
jgi:hypothetical protein